MCRNGTTAVLPSGQTCTTCGTLYLVRCDVGAEEVSGRVVRHTGRKRTREWLLDPDEDSRRTIGQDIATVEYGWPAGMPLCRHLVDGLLEVRSDFTAGRIARVIFVIHEDRMVLLHGFMQKAQKTLKPALDLPRKRAEEVTS